MGRDARGRGGVCNRRCMCDGVRAEVGVEAGRELERLKVEQAREQVGRVNVSVCVRRV